MKILPKSITKFNRDLLTIDGRSVFNHFNLGFYDKSLSKTWDAVDYHVENYYFRRQNSRARINIVDGSIALPAKPGHLATRHHLPAIVDKLHSRDSHSQRP